MKKYIAIIILLLIFSPSILFADEIACETGNCSGWLVTYEQSGDYFIYNFENNSGKPAYYLTCRINFYDMGGNPLGSISERALGPIHKFIKFKSRFPRDTYRLSAEVYYKSNY